MPDIDLQLLLSRNRNYSGLLLVKERSSGKVLGQFEALGRGSQGAGDTQMVVNGNTPTGSYRVSRLEDSAQWNQSSYGPNGVLRLEPVSGNALAAEQMAGREGLLIHGGSLGGAGYWRGTDELRATHGCVRVSNESMRTLNQLLFESTQDNGKMQCTPVDVRLNVSDHDMSFKRP